MCLIKTSRFPCGQDGLYGKLRLRSAILNVVKYSCGMSPLTFIFVLSFCGCCCVAVVVGQWGRARSRSRRNSTSTKYHRFNPSLRAQSPTTTLKPFPGFVDCPNGLNDEELGECFTAGFADILPYLPREEGLPHIGIKGLDPQYIPKLSIQFVDITIAKFILNIENMVVTNTADLSKPAVFKINRTTRLLDLDFTIRKLIGNGWGHFEGHVLGIPWRWFTGNGTVHFEAVEVVTRLTFVFERREPGQSFMVKRFEAEPTYFHAHTKGIHAGWIERAFNWLSSETTGKFVYKRVFEVHFLEVFKGIAARFMDPIYWNSVAGEHLD